MNNRLSHAAQSVEVISKKAVLKECVDLANTASPLGTWSERNLESDTKVIRGGRVMSDTIDYIEGIFEAKRVRDDDNASRWPKVYYILRLVASKDLVLQELPDIAKRNLTLAESSASLREEIWLQDGTYTDEDLNFDDDRGEDDTYTHRREIQYRFDARGTVIDYVASELYEINGEETASTAFVVESLSQVSMFDVQSANMIHGLNEAHIDTISDDVYNDMLFMNFIVEYKNECEFAGMSQQEHIARSMAILSFIRMKSSAKAIIETVFA